MTLSMIQNLCVSNGYAGYKRFVTNGSTTGTDVGLKRTGGSLQKNISVLTEQREKFILSNELPFISCVRIFLEELQIDGGQDDKKR